ncbi:hypothetical protein BDW62DRAFT_14036 [Aspergillus aurantiobrunneus]
MGELVWMDLRMSACGHCGGRSQICTRPLESAPRLNLCDSCDGRALARILGLDCFDWANGIDCWIAHRDCEGDCHAARSLTLSASSFTPPVRQSSKGPGGAFSPFARAEAGTRKQGRRAHGTLCTPPRVADWDEDGDASQSASDPKGKTNPEPRALGITRSGNFCWPRGNERRHQHSDRLETGSGPARPVGGRSLLSPLPSALGYECLLIFVTPRGGGSSIHWDDSLFIHGTDTDVLSCDDSVT